ncbi:unnamed protein product [Ostreobium quekettii]|uniref:Uncharacterized protein n=1 Tax=Ostreobium quekettii TaxID=121088 RepID=A0A8S1ILB7_9CHLO|nr:unnamed protein product [Ostreobium quekettii]
MLRCGVPGAVRGFGWGLETAGGGRFEKSRPPLREIFYGRIMGMVVVEVLCAGGGVATFGLFSFAGVLYSVEFDGIFVPTSSVAACIDGGWGVGGFRPWMTKQRAVSLTGPPC